jgi:hypothetical protein
VSGKLWDEQPPVRQQQGCEREPVRGPAAETMDEHERLALASDEVAQPAATHLGEALLEICEFNLCVCHPGRLLFDAMDRSGRQDP